VYGGSKPIAREGGSFNTKKRFFEMEIHEQHKLETTQGKYIYVVYIYINRVE
jgi:hypothetical protein